MGTHPSSLWLNGVLFTLLSTDLPLLPAATSHDAATVHYVIERYQTSFAYNVFAICSNGNLIKFLYYPYGIYELVH